jgi:hypothetical protein
VEVKLLLMLGQRNEKLLWIDSKSSLNRLQVTLLDLHCPPNTPAGKQIRFPQHKVAKSSSLLLSFRQFNCRGCSVSWKQKFFCSFTFSFIKTSHDSRSHLTKCLLDHEGEFPGATLAKVFLRSRSVPRVFGRKAIPLVVCARNYRRAAGSTCGVNAKSH